MKPLLRLFLFIACLAPAWTLAQPTETPESSEAAASGRETLHPRPTLTRATWTDLSGQWAFQKQPATTTAAPSAWGGVIQVPFCPESKLSGIEKLTAPDESLWYQRDLPVAPASGERTLLHFEAVDYETTVWVNDKEVGKHTGGFTPFSFDITSALKATGNTLRVRVNDATEGYQLRGKQALQPKGITYTRVSGIWQTVWLEQVPQRSIQDLDFKTVLAKGSSGSATKAELQIRTTLAGPPVKGESVRVTVSSGDNEIAMGKGNPDLSLEISAPKLWTPDSPHLYQLKVELLDASGGAIDTVQSYTALHPYTTIKFVYDWQGRRVARTVWQGGTSTTPTFKSNRRWLYDGWNVIAEFSATSEIATTATRLNTLTWGLDLSGNLRDAGGVGGLLSQNTVAGGAIHRASYDGNGNIVAWTKSDQTVPVHRREYDAFGNTLISEGTSPSTFGFSTKMQDTETGLYYYGYRYYDPSTGRWLGRNPIGESGGLNLYGFVSNDGIGSMDVLGLSQEDSQCKGEVVFGHFTYIAKNVRGIDDEFDDDKRNKEDKHQKNDPLTTCYVGCGMNQLNDQAKKGGWGVPNAPQNNWPPRGIWPQGMSPKSPNGPIWPAVQNDSDYLPEDEVEDRLEKSIKATAKTLCSKACNCGSVSVTVRCTPKFANDPPSPGVCGKTKIFKCSDIQ